MAFPVLLVDMLHNLESEQVRRLSPAEQKGGSPVQEDEPSRRLDINGIGRELDEPPVAVLALAQGPLRPAARRDHVVERRCEPADLVGRLDRRRLHRNAPFEIADTFGQSLERPRHPADCAPHDYAACRDEHEHQAHVPSREGGDLASIALFAHHDQDMTDHPLPRGAGLRAEIHRFICIGN